VVQSTSVSVNSCGSWPCIEWPIAAETEHIDLDDAFDLMATAILGTARQLAS